MFVARVIPSLLLHRGGLVKTIRFRNPRYVGDPINTVRIFNEKEVDELILLDIDASVMGKEPDYDAIEDIVSEAFMPVCYGGGVTSTGQMQRLFRIGVEKVSISTAALADATLVEEASVHFGSQSVVVTLDVRKRRMRSRYEVVTHNGTRRTGLDPVDTARRMEQRGSGELVINNVDKEGEMSGYDVALVKQIASAVDVPVVALGGAGTMDHLRSVVADGGACAAVAGSMFVFKGVHRAVLINYPAQSELAALFRGED